MKHIQRATVVVAVLCGLGRAQAEFHWTREYHGALYNCVDDHCVVSGLPGRAGSGWKNYTAPSMSAPRIWIKGEYCAEANENHQPGTIPEDYIVPLEGCSGDACNTPYFQRLLEEVRQPPAIACIRYEGRIYCGEIVRRPR